MITLVGDCHGKLRDLKLTKEEKDSCVIALGDVGFGFSYKLRATNKTAPINSELELAQFGIDFFISGNHDNPEECEKHSAYLGKYGYNSDLDLFWVSGADSIDKAIRTEGLDWWPNEQLSYKEMNDALELYMQSKPRIVLSHDCPISVAKRMFGFSEAKLRYNNTNLGLQSMFEYHQPELQIFGHYHQDKFKKINGTLFRCVAELSKYTIKT